MMTTSFSTLRVAGYALDEEEVENLVEEIAGTIEDDDVAKEIIGDNVLGHTWKPQADEFVFAVDVNECHRRREVKTREKTGPDIRNCVKMVDKDQFTKGKALSSIGIGPSLPQSP